MPLYLVRHAKAGSRSGWVGPDEKRPLSKGGREQADALARNMADAPVTRVVSSPYVRCMETVAPLADKVGVVVEPNRALAEGRTVSAAIELLVSLPDNAVACSHGDMIPAVVDALVRQGMQVDGEP